MSHSVQINLIADMEIKILGTDINIYDIEVIVLDSYGIIERVYLRNNTTIDNNTTGLEANASYGG